MYSVIAHDGQAYGPVDMATLVHWCQQGRIVADTHIVETYTGRAMLARDIPDLQGALAQSQSVTQTTYAAPTFPQYPGAMPAYGQAPRLPSGPSIYGGFGAAGAPKSKSTAILLCILLGGFGAHRFYLGHTTTAIAQLVLSLLGFALCFPLVIVGIWTLIDLAALASNSLPDAQGVVPV